MKQKPIVIVDNGGSALKLGVAGKNEVNARIVPNAVVRSKGDRTTYFGNEIERCRDFSSLHYRLPFEKGYPVDWDAQKAVWDGLFTSEFLGVNPTESSLLITEPYFNLPNLQDVYDQFVFEEYEFQSYYRCTPASMIPFGDLYAKPGLPSPECMVVIDAGFSFTHVVPIMNGEVVWSAVKRIDVGGKLLTNQLKELTSFRQWNMMDETYIMNNVKEACCYVSLDFKRDLETCRTHARQNPIVQEYILPDFSANRPGRVRNPDEHLEDSQQILYMNNERFSVPEILFCPDDIGLEQSGLPATVAHSISLLPEDLQGMFWANISLIGGSTKFPFFRDRLLIELRSLAPVDCEVGIYQSPEPIMDAYRSAVSFSKRPDFSQHMVTRAEYLEMGSNASRRKFRDWKPLDNVKGRETAKGRAVRFDQELEEGDEDLAPRKRGRGRGRGAGVGAGGTSRRRVNG